MILFAIGRAAHDNVPNAIHINPVIPIIPPMPDENDLPRYDDSLWEEPEATAIQRINENKRYLQALDWDQMNLVETLPDVHINEYDEERFKFEQNTIRMIMRKTYIDFLCKLIPKKSK